ncbi:MAG: DUF2946 domain-containing protein [Magnetospirillum sp.]|nr:MAG: DUF2946 domain-containing protein [Magnetospirillum sp.]
MSTVAARHSPAPAGFRRFVSWLGVFLVLFNLIASGLLPAAASPLAGERIVVCTAQGMVVLGADGQPSATDEGAERHADLCAFCLPLMHASGAPQPVLLGLDALPARAIGSFAAPVSAPLPPARPEGISSPRAPPTS